MAHDELASHCVELFTPLGATRSRRMFGGHGVYIDDLFVALIADERIYLKVDAHTQPAFEAAGCEPFCYAKDSRQVTLGYWSAPADAVDSPAQMRPWARLAIEAALRARAAKRPARPRRPRSSAAAPDATVRQPKAAVRATRGRQKA
jgi:DNA transformation protein and related proteins